MDMERLIIQNINKSSIKESIGASTSEPYNSDTRELLDLVDTFNVLREKGYYTYPEQTAEKLAYRAIEAKLVSLGLNLTTEPKIETPEIPGDFESEKDLSKLG